MTQGRIALVTGGGRGLGRVMALSLLENGHKVIISSTDQESLRSVAEESGAARDRISYLVADLSIKGNAEQLAVEASSIYGSIDILINNAGLGIGSARADAISHPYRFWESNRGVIELFFQVNVISAMILSIRLAPAMITKGWGRIISNTTSLHTMLRYSLYGGSKSALEAETAIMAKDLEGTGVTANVLVPGGGTVSRMNEQLGLTRENLLPDTIMKAPLAFLASEAADGFTGRRILARRWNDLLKPQDAAWQASDSIAWTELAERGLARQASEQVPEGPSALGSINGGIPNVGEPHFSAAPVRKL